MYRSQLAQISLSGPTLFAPILKQMIEIAKSRLSMMCYNVMLILTDGEIHDMGDTVDLICQAAEYPISIIIVGVGNESFVNMKRLDADGTVLKDRYSNPAKRDIVQFVKFNDFYSKGPEALAQEVLKELPG